MAQNNGGGGRGLPRRRVDPPRAGPRGAAADAGPDGSVSGTDRRRPDPDEATRRESYPALRAGRQRGRSPRLGRTGRGGHVRRARVAQTPGVARESGGGRGGREGGGGRGGRGGRAREVRDQSPRALGPPRQQPPAP